ncbi:hypothetical protein DUI87_21309 [Hirundo rustica rustica]|uniref:glycerol kinase n=1 Tax=Hirundo rustica rustica TaxID=333673 RepID=A0A3M0JMH7_HIRRU|nr:hypothetical protein DUI87_21309 [Hirundo rustica rustica]
MPCGQPDGGAAPAQYVLGVDVGSTVVKCHVYDRAAAVRGSGYRKVESLYPRPGWVELDPEVLWSQFIGVIKETVQGSVYATDYSNASSTGIFEPFTKCWNPTLCNLLSIPMSIYPPVKDTSFNFGSTDSEIFGIPIPIMAVVADQQSAMFGECCFHPGDVKLTMGTGGFWNVNTGEHLFASRGSLYPLIGWKIGEEIVYLTEGSISDIGTAIKWAQDMELFTNVDETAEMARSIADSQGVCFIPGLQVSGNDPYLCASFMGLKPSTNRNHLVRAILESVAFRNKLLYDIIVKKVHIPLRTIRADGGVSNNSFVMQMTSDLINKKIEKPANADMSSLGAAFLAGLASGWCDFHKWRFERIYRSEPESNKRVHAQPLGVFLVYLATGEVNAHRLLRYCNLICNISVITLPVSSTNSPTKILPKTLGPINVNVGPQMIISTPQRLTSSGSVLIGSPYNPAPTMVTQTHITEASGWVPGERKRTQEIIESDFSESKRSKKGDKNGKGLRHFSMKVCEKVQRKGTTSYNEVADELVSEFTNSNSHLPADSAYDQKNIRRRVYDALNVLMAMNIISKEKKEIRWIGLPTNSAQECQNLEIEKQKRIERIKQKRAQLQELLLQQIAFKNLVQRNQQNEQQNQGPPSLTSTIQLPFLIVNTSKRTIIDCSISSDKFEYLFNFDNTFEIHDDSEVLKRMGMSFGLEAGKCSAEDLRTAKSLVPKALEGYITDMSTGFSWINQGLLSSSAQAVSHFEAARGTYDAKSSENPGLCLDAEVALATGQLLGPSSQQSSSAASRGETPCSFNEEDEEDEDEDSSSPE